MSTLHWTSATSGNFETGADWTGGVAPGAADTAIIDAAPPAGGGYTVTLHDTATVAGLVLDQAQATLAISQGSLTAPAIDLLAGGILLRTGTLSGTVTATGGGLGFTGSGNVLENVTWQGTLAAFGTTRGPAGTLTIRDGLTLTGAGGLGPGSATFDGSVVFDNVAGLDNAAISAGNVSFTGAAMTLGGQLALNASAVAVGAQQTLTNNGTLVTPALSVAGTFVNDGSVTGGADFSAGMLQNNGALSATTARSAIVMSTANAAAAQAGSVHLSGGGQFLVAGTLTTAQLAAQHVSADKLSGIGIEGVLNNAGASLAIGPGTTLPNLAAASTGTISGGTITDLAGSGIADAGAGGNLTLNGVTLTTAKPGFTFTGVNFTNGTFTGSKTLTLADGQGPADLSGSTFNGVQTLALAHDSAILNGTSFTGVTGPVRVAVNYQSTLYLDPGQSLAGLAITAGSGVLRLSPGAAYDNGTIAVTPYGSLLVQGGGALGAHTALTVAAGGNLNIAAGPAGDSITLLGSLGIAGGGVATVSGAVTNGGNITSAGGVFDMLGSASFTNTGTIAMTGGSLVLDLANLTNSGAMSVTNGTLVLGGPLSLASLTSVADPGSTEMVTGTLDLGGKTIGFGADTPAFALGPNGAVTDGTLNIAAGQALTVTPWLAGTTIAAGLVNNGTVTVTGSAAAAAITGAISGSGTIALAGAGDTVTFANPAGSGQTIAFLGHNDVLAFASPQAAATGATLAGFAVGDQVRIQGGTVTSAGFTGDSIVATLSTGATISLATSSALTGSLAIGNSDGTATLTYVANTGAESHGWSLPGESSASLTPHVEAVGAGWHADLPGDSARRCRGSMWWFTGTESLASGDQGLGPWPRFIWADRRASSASSPQPVMKPVAPSRASRCQVLAAGRRRKSRGNSHAALSRCGPRHRPRAAPGKAACARSPDHAPATRTPA